MNLRTMWNNAGVHYRGLWYRIDTTNACGLTCPTCARAKFATPKGIMSMDIYKAILDKALREGKIRSLELYAWGDSMLNPKLHEFCEHAVSLGIKTITTSSTFNTVKCDLPKVMASGISTVFVSFSGWEKYHITHRGGNLTQVLKNFKTLAKTEKHPNTRVVMRFHIYTHNHDEIAKAKELCNEYGWEMTAYEAQWMENASLVYGTLTDEDLKVWDMLPWKPKDGKRSEFCYYQTKAVVIDANGKTFLCCVTPYADEFKTGDFLTTPLKVIRQNMAGHSFCVQCKDKGLNSYQLGRGGK